MLKKIIALALVGGVAVACTQEGLDGTQTEALEQGLSCTTNGGINPTKASLAVAMATELGTWDPLKHLTDTNPWDYRNPVSLSNEGNNLCNSRGGCPNTIAILGLQNDAIAAYIPQNIFNTISFRGDLKQSFGRQYSLELDLSRNNPGALPEAHKLVSLGAPTNLGGCGVHFGFAATKPDGTPLAKPANLANRLAFFGYGSYGGMNPFIDFRSAESKVYVDPTEGDQTGGSTGSGSCMVLPQVRLYDPSWTNIDKCCMYTSSNGVGLTGTLKVLVANPKYLYCKTT